MPGTLRFAQRQISISQTDRNGFLIGSFSQGPFKIFLGQIKLLDGHEHIGSFQQILRSNRVRFAYSSFRKTQGNLLLSLVTSAFMSKQSGQRQTGLDSVGVGGFQGACIVIHCRLVIAEGQERLAGGDEYSGVGGMLFRCSDGFESFIPLMKLGIGSCHLCVNEGILLR